VWVSGTGDNDGTVIGPSAGNFDLIKGGKHDPILNPRSGQIIRRENSTEPVFGGYGGLLSFDPDPANRDAPGVIWSAGLRNLLWWNTSNPLSGDNGDPVGSDIGPTLPGTNWAGQDGDSYGLCLDDSRNVWNTQSIGNSITKYNKDGVFLDSFSHGFNSAKGCVVDFEGDVWVAHLESGTSVGHIKNDGSPVGKVDLRDLSSVMDSSPAKIEGDGPTGVAVDSKGYIWVTNLVSNSLSRIDPKLGTAGKVDLTVDLGEGAKPYNYSDMTGREKRSLSPMKGSWTVVTDSGSPRTQWDVLRWNDEAPCDEGPPPGSNCIPANTSLTVKACSSSDGVKCQGTEGFKEVTFNQDLDVPDGQYLIVMVEFRREVPFGASPVLSNLKVYAKSL